MRPEVTVLNPFVIITPRNKLSAYRIWLTLPPYRLRSILKCKPVYLKNENIKSAQIANDFWTFNISNDDYVEIILQASKDEVQGGFELSGPAPTPLLKILKHYVVRAPSLLTIALILILISIGLQISNHYKTEEFLNQYPLYHQYPKEFFLAVKSRLVIWCVVLPSTLSPFLVSSISLLGPWKSHIGRVQSAVKVESWLMLLVGFILIYNFPFANFVKHPDILFAPLNSSKLERAILYKTAEEK